MGFKKVDCVKELEDICKKDKDIAKYVEEFNEEYDTKNTFRKVEWCPKCGNLGAEVIKEDLQTQGSTVTFKCAECQNEFEVRY